MTGETNRPAIEPRNNSIGMQTESAITECNTDTGATREPGDDPARSKTLGMLGSVLHGSWEISSVPEAQESGGTGKAQSRNPVAYADEKSDVLVVPKNPSNKGGDPAEMASVRSAAKGNVSENPAPRTPSRIKIATMGLEGVRIEARFYASHTRGKSRMR